MLPILFTWNAPWGAQPIYSYGVLLGLSLIIGYPIVMRFGARVPGTNTEVLGNGYIVSALCGIIGARALFVLENRELLEDTGARWFQITAGGVTAYGGLLGGVFGLWLFARVKRVSLPDYADAAAPAVALGIVLTRIGCYLYGCDFGSPLEEDAPGWLKHLGTFPRWHLDALHVYGSPAWLHHVDRYALPSSSQASMAVHPTQLYEALVGVALLALSLWLWPRRKFAGQVALILAIGYGVSRFCIEYVRDDPERGFAFGYSSAQLISFAVVPVCAVIYSVLRGNTRRT